MRKAIIFPILLILLLPFAFSNYWEDHFYINENALGQVTPSTWSKLIEGREDIFHGCNAGTDALVTGYLTKSGRKSYQQLHQRIFYQNCFVNAGSDDDLRVCCLGAGSHITQDAYSSHGYKSTQGFTPQCIETYWGTNVMMHAACENAMTEQLLDSLPNYERDRLVLAAGNAYDIFIDKDNVEVGLQNKFALLLAKSADFDTQAEKDDFYSSLATVGRYVKEGQGSGYKNMWRDFTEVPSAWWFIPLLVLIACILGIPATILYGKNKWKWVMFGILLVTTIALGVYFTAMLTGKAYIWYKSFATYTPTLLFSLIGGIGIIGIIVGLGSSKAIKVVSMIIFTISIGFAAYALVSTGGGKIVIPNHQMHLDNGIEETVKFLENAELTVADGSGLDYQEYGRDFKGTLTQAEARSNFVQYILLGEVLFLLGILIAQMRKS